MEAEEDRRLSLYAGIADIERLSGSGEEDRGEGEGEEGEKSLTGVSSKALVTAYFLFLSGKIKICIQENLLLQEHVRYSNSACSLLFLTVFV